MQIPSLQLWSSTFIAISIGFTIKKTMENHSLHLWSRAFIVVYAGVLMLVLYLVHINKLLKNVPKEIREIADLPWTTQQLKNTYDELRETPMDYTNKLPPKLNRRYIVTGGNGLVGGFIVLQLLARGTSPTNIRIVDIRKPERNDMNTPAVAEIEYIETDIRSAAAVGAAFDKPWDSSIAHLPLTVFHTAAVILASDRSKYLYKFPYDVNVRGTMNVVAAAKAAGAQILSSTSSASISIRPVDPWVSFLAKEPRNFWQTLDEQDFNQPLRADEDFFGNYPRTKALAERIVCDANSNEFRTGCIRPANGVYGNPTDNSVGGPLSRSVQPTWIPHIVQSYVHGANVAVAHLQQEAVLASTSHVKDIPQAGRPFVVTDPNPPITFADVYTAISTLSIYPFSIQLLPPVLILVLSHIVEWYTLLPYRIPQLKGLIPRIKGDARHLQPRMLTICTHLVGSDAEARKPVTKGGLGYEGIMTTLQGVVLEILEWNKEHGWGEKSPTAGAIEEKKKLYTSSVMFAEQLKQSVDVGGALPI